MIKVLIILDNDLMADGRVLKEIAVLEKHNIDYKVLCYDYGNEYVNDERIKRIKNGRFLKYKLQAISNTFPIIHVLWKREIKKLIAEFDPNFIHIHDLYMFPPVWKAVNKMEERPKLILDLHENYPYAIKTYSYATKKLNRYLVRPDLWEKKEGTILKNADHIIVLDRTYADQLIDKYPILSSDKFTVFPNYADLEVLGEDKEMGTEVRLEGVIMLYFGVVGKSRGIMEAVNGVISARSSGADVSFLIIGPVNKAYIKTFNDIEKHHFVQHIPWIQVNQLNSYMSICNFAIAPFEINPQIESGIANKIFQYLFGNLPIIVSNAKPMARLVEKYNCGTVYKSPSDLSKAIYSFSMDRELLQEKKRNIQKILYEDYAPFKFEERLIKIYNN